MMYVNQCLFELQVTEAGVREHVPRQPRSLLADHANLQAAHYVNDLPAS